MSAVIHAFKKSPPCTCTDVKSDVTALVVQTGELRPRAADTSLYY